MRPSRIHCTRHANVRPRAPLLAHALALTLTLAGASTGVPAEVRLYDRLFTEAQPDAGGRDFLSVLNANSKKIVLAYVEPGLMTAQADERFQFERHGYFVADRIDHGPQGLVFNRTATLKDNPALGKALTGAWFEIMALMKAKDKDALTHMAKASGTDLPGYEAQLTTTAMMYTPADMLAFVSGYGQSQLRQRDPQAWYPTRLNLGAGTDYKPGWLNVDPQPQTEPDLLLDLGRPQRLPMLVSGALCGPVRLEAGQFDEVCAGHVLVRTPDLPTLMTQALALLLQTERELLDALSEGERQILLELLHKVACARPR